MSPSGSDTGDGSGDAQGPGPFDPASLAPHPDDRPPEGFAPSSRGPFTTHNGPFYQKVLPGALLHGFRARQRHCNGAGIVHGGLLMAFADGLLAAAIWRETRARMVTMRMTSDFLAMARPGEWVEGAGVVDHADADVAYASGHIYVGERSVLRVHGIFKLMNRR